MVGVVALAFGAITTNALAYGFGQRLDLSLPLWLWMIGAGLSVILAFAAVIDFLPRVLTRLDYPRISIFTNRSPRQSILGVSLWGLQLLVVAIYALTIIAALAGVNDAATNLVPTIVWVLFWVGVAFISALIGDLWALLNPLRSIFMALE